MGDDRPVILFVTGRLAEFALRQVIDEFAPRVGIEPKIAVLPITVAALMPPNWIARHLEVPPEVDRIILPGLCKGDWSPIQDKVGAVTLERGPEDLRDLPRYFGLDNSDSANYGEYNIEIIAEINHAPTLTPEAILEAAKRFVQEGADRIDLGCDPGGPWYGVGEAVAALRESGIRVSIDSFDTVEVEEATNAGADLVLSVNGTNRDHALDWGVEVVVIPDQVGTLEGLDQSVEFLTKHGIPFRLDPIIEPIGFGLAKSLGRYLEVRDRYREIPMMMGVGNLTELTDVDSSGINVLLTGFCQELAIESVLTTAVINWARSSVREIDLARRLAYHAVTRRTLPKHREDRLVTLRDPSIPQFGRENLLELQRRIRDPNWRIFAEDNTLFALNNQCFLEGEDPFAVFDQMKIDDAEHAFYLGYELSKAKTALTLHKQYRQDQALDWGFLTEPEVSAIERRKWERRSQEGRPQEQENKL